MGDISLDITCQRHGKSYATFVCGHLVHGRGLGFVQSDDDDDDPRPVAWCNECDSVLMEEGEWNDKSEAFADFKVICAHCYDEVRRRNLTGVAGRENGINRTWFLDNVLDLHDEYPETFQILSEEERRGLQIGDLAKLIFTLPVPDNDAEYQGERMWVTVVKKDAIGYRGLLESIPYTKGTIHHGEQVLFGPEHIVDILVASEQGSVPEGNDSIMDIRHNLNLFKNKNRKHD